MPDDTKTTENGTAVAAPVDVDVMRYLWLPGWYATRLHAVKKGANLPHGHASIQAECGAWVYGKAPTDWAQRRVDKGVPHCKRCAKLVGA